MHPGTEVADPRFSNNGTGSDGFTLVVRKKNRKNRNGLSMKERSPVEKLERSMADLRSDAKWLEKCIQIIRDAVATLPAEIQIILCLGLGSPAESAQARFQLCFLLEMRDTIFPNPIRILAFDPVFTPEDKLLLTSLGIQILLDNKQGRHELEGPTVAFMPHCDRELYENFLSTNGSSLSELLLIGNDLRGYTESIPSRVLGKESPCISQIAPLLVSTPLPKHSAFPNAFSSTAVQHITSASLAETTLVVPQLSQSPANPDQAPEENPIGHGHNITS